jgi:hypothetical protein
MHLQVLRCCAASAMMATTAMQLAIDAFDRLLTMPVELPK